MIILTSTPALRYKSSVSVVAFPVATVYGLSVFPLAASSIGNRSALSGFGESLVLLYWSSGNACNAHLLFALFTAFRNSVRSPVNSC